MAVFTEWVRRCERCRTIEQRKAWADSASAQTDLSLNERSQWYDFRRARWQCQACGGHEYTVQPHEWHRRS